MKTVREGCDDGMEGQLRVEYLFLNTWLERSGRYDVQPKLPTETWDAKSVA